MALVINETNSLYGSGFSVSHSDVGGKITVTTDGTVSAPNDFGFFLRGAGAWTIGVNGLISGDVGIMIAEQLRPLSNITIGATGEIFADAGLYLNSRTNVVNHGRIHGTSVAILQSSIGAYTITNYGEITSQLGNDDAAIRMDLGAPGEVVGTHTIINSGLIQAWDGVNIGDAIFANGFSPIVINNTGTINGHLDLGFGRNKITNSGLITGDIFTYNGMDILTNSGTVEGFVHLGGGADTVVNTGKFLYEVNLGAGNDKYTGNATAETVDDEAGADTYSLLGGDDRFYAEGAGSAIGIDIVSAGTNAAVSEFLGTYGDIYDAFGAVNPVFVNLDVVVRLGRKASTATGIDVGIDRITGFESAYGGDAGDTLVGSAAVNVLWGRAGDDTLLGLGGNDLLYGDVGADRIIGGAGKDTIYGDADADTFVYSVLTDSTADRRTRDVIRDFEDGIDHFDFTALGLANATFIGQNIAFSPTAGQSEIRVLSKLIGWSVQVDRNGDGRADMVIDVSDAALSIVWDSTDFL